jgi:ABC-type nitrate/sulfonate/bicarbonate transport system substrate-binding protein
MKKTTPADKTGKRRLLSDRGLLHCLAGATAVITFFMALSGCWENHQGLKKVNVRLGWQVNANSAGQIAALEEGFYQQAGLDVILRPGGLADPSVKTVGGGEDLIGFANGPDLVINAVAAGAPLKIVAVIQQQSYHGFFVRKDSNIKSPKDWSGRRVGVKYASPTYLLYQVLLAQEGVDPSTVTEVPLQYGLQPFLAGDIDVYPGAITNEAISIERQGIPLRIIHPADYGIETCGNVIFSTQDVIDGSPELIASFVEATMRGWRWCLDESNEERTLDYLQKHSPSLDREKEREALRLNASLVQHPRGIGHVDMEKLGRILAYMREFGVLNVSINPQDICTKTFTE